MERRQAVHELHVRVAGRAEQVRVDLVGQQQLDALVPDLLGLAHRDPHVGVDEVDAGHALRPTSSVWVIRAPVPCGDLRRLLDDLVGGFHSACGATMRTSMPSIAPATSRELPTLLRASPR